MMFQVAFFKDEYIDIDNIDGALLSSGYFDIREI